MLALARPLLLSAQTLLTGSRLAGKSPDLSCCGWSDKRPQERASNSRPLLPPAASLAPEQPVLAHPLLCLSLLPPWDERPPSCELHVATRRASEALKEGQVAPVGPHVALDAHGHSIALHHEHAAHALHLPAYQARRLWHPVCWHLQHDFVSSTQPAGLWQWPCTMSTLPTLSISLRIRRAASGTLSAGTCGVAVCQQLQSADGAEAKVRPRAGPRAQCPRCPRSPLPCVSGVPPLVPYPVAPAVQLNVSS